MPVCGMIIIIISSFLGLCLSLAVTNGGRHSSPSGVVSRIELCCSPSPFAVGDSVEEPSSAEVHYSFHLTICPIAGFCFSVRVCSLSLCLKRQHRKTAGSGKRSVRLTNLSGVPDYSEIPTRFSLGPQGAQLPWCAARRHLWGLDLAGRQTIGEGLQMPPSSLQGARWPLQLS